MAGCLVTHLGGERIPRNVPAVGEDAVQFARGRHYHRQLVQVENIPLFRRNVDLWRLANANKVRDWHGSRREA